MRRGPLLFFLIVLCSGMRTAQAQDWPALQMSFLVNGLDQPTHVTDAGDGRGRIFIVEQPGKIRIFKDGALLAQPFLDISDRVLLGEERGLLSIAFRQNFATVRHFFVHYTDLSGNLQISRFSVTDDPQIADPGSEAPVLSIDHPTYSNHNGGQLAFGADGYLYIGPGDGGGGGDPFGNAQNPSSLLGKLLRIDVESSAPYTVPATNPFVGVAGYRPEIWALGLRNPWRFSFDSLTRDLYIADVGQDLYEEVDFQPSSSGGGQNYGWNTMEGFHCFSPREGCSTEGLTLPVAEYDHFSGDCAIIGGFVYRGSANPAMQGIYYYGDWCSGRIWGLRQISGSWQTSPSPLLESGLRITTFGKDEAGNLLVADGYSGSIYVVNQVTAP